MSDTINYGALFEDRVYGFYIDGHNNGVYDFITGDKTVTIKSKAKRKNAKPHVFNKYRHCTSEDVTVIENLVKRLNEFSTNYSYWIS